MSFLETTDDVAYDLYLVIFQRYHEGRLPLGRATQILTIASSISSAAWRVVGITKEALAAFEEIGFTNKPKGIQRAHLVDRVETFRQLLNAANPVQRSHFQELVSDGDRTVLCLEGQNKRIAGIPFIALENPDGKLFANKFIGCSYRSRHEGEALRQLMRTDFST